MKLIKIVGALCLALSAQLVQSQTVTITVPGLAGCQITGITALTASAGNVFTATGGTPTGCGGGGGVSSPNVSVSPASQSFTLNSTVAVPQIVWSASNAVSCNAAATGAAIFNTFSFAPTDGSPWPRSTTDLSKEICTAAGNCGGVINATPIIGAVAGSYHIGVTCTSSTGQQASSGSTIILAPPIVNNPPPTDTTCLETTTTDIRDSAHPTSSPVTRQCSGSVVYKPDAASVPAYSGPLSDSAVYTGAWPFSQYGGIANTVSVAKTSFVSFKFVATTSNTVKLGANVSWGSGGWISISEGTPGLFMSSSAGNGYICGQAAGGSNSLQISTNGWAGASCQLQIGHTYYLNLTNYTVSGGVGSANCRNAYCTMAYNPSFVN